MTAKAEVAPAALVAEVKRALARLAAEGPDERELEAAKNVQRAAFLRRLESPLERATQLASYDRLAPDAEFLARDLARHRDVGPEQVRAAVAKYLRARGRVVLIVQPRRPAS